MGERLGPIGAKNGNANKVFQSMRYVFAFRWSDSLEVNKSIDRVDATNDLVGITLNLAIAISKRVKTSELALAREQMVLALGVFEFVYEELSQYRPKIGELNDLDPVIPTK